MRLFLIVLIGVFLIASVSAYQKTYDAEAETILIESDGGADLLKLTLIENTYFCATKCHAIIQIDVLTDGLSAPFSPFKIKKKIGGVFVDSSIQSLSFQHNNSGSWQSLTINQFNNGLANSGTYWVKLNGIKGAQETVDWVPSMFSGALDLEEWALWDGDGIQRYYAFDETSGDVVDSVELDNATNQGATRGVTGLLNNAFEFDGSTDFVDSFQVDNDTNFSISVWIKPTLSASYQSFFQAGNLICSVSHSVSNNVAMCNVAGNEIRSDQTLQDGVWSHVVFVFEDGATSKVYINGTFTGTTTTALDRDEFDLDGAGFIGKYSGGQFFDGTIDEMAIFNKTLTSAEVLQLYNDHAGEGFEGELTVSINSPGNNTIGVVTEEQVFNFTANAGSDDLVNATLYIDDTLNETISITGSTNTSTFNKYLAQGNYWWTIEVCDDSVSCTNSTLRYLTITDYEVDNYFYNQYVFDTKNETFTLQITYDDSVYTDVSAILNYAGTNYSATQEGSGSTINFTKTLDIPLVSVQQTRDFYWFVELNDSRVEQSATKNQTVNETIFTLCNATYSETFLNISFFDEGNSSPILATIPTSTFSYSLAGNLYKNYTFTNSTASYGHTFCSNVGGENIFLNPYVQYKGGDYPQRIYDPVAFTISNTTENVSLYLLQTADGQYVTFQVVDLSENIITGVAANVTREISGSPVIVGQGTTDAAGTVTFWLDPNFVHTISFTKAGYDSYSSSLTPTQTSYTITLGGGATTAPTNYFNGMTWSILPTNTSLQNDTTYTFGFLLTSSNLTLDEYGFNLRFSNGTLISGGTTSTSGTQLTLDYDVNNISIIYLDYFWKVDGNYTNLTTSWKVFNTLNTQWSIKTFFTDLNTYLDSGIFGLDNFGRYVLIFLLIFLSFGVVTYKFGVQSPVMVTFILFAIIFSLDAVAGIIPTVTLPNGLQVPYVLTFLAALIMVVTIFREVRT